jgi:biopolymer transport protein ExbD
MINLRQKKKENAEVFTSAMNDIMFFLMLFFIIASTLLNPSIINVALPKASSTETLHKKEMDLTITKDGHYYINNKETTFENLETAISAEMKSGDELVIKLRLDKDGTVQQLVDVLAVGNKLKAKMVIATDKN